MSDCSCFGCNLYEEIEEVRRLHKKTHETSPELGEAYLKNVLITLAKAEDDITAILWEHYGKLVN